MIGTKRERPKKECVACHKEKPIVKHLNGDPNAPLCAACYMRLRRAAASNDQVKAVKLTATVIGNLEQLAGLDVEREHEQEILAMQDRLKTLMRVWLGDEAADIKEDAFAGDRAEALGAEHDSEFETKTPKQPRKRGPMPPEQRAKISVAHKARGVAKRAKVSPEP